jgi:hypothetical protein
MNNLKYASIKKTENHFFTGPYNDDKLSTLALCFADSALWPDDIKEKLTNEKRVNTAGNLLRFLIEDDTVFLEPSYWASDDLEEDEPNSYQIIIPRNVLLAIIDEGMKWMKKKVDRVVFMHYKNHYFVADRVLTEHELDSILHDSQNNEIIPIKDH